MSFKRTAGIQDGPPTQMPRLVDANIQQACLTELNIQLASLSRLDTVSAIRYFDDQNAETYQWMCKGHVLRLHVSFSSGTNAFSFRLDDDNQTVFRTGAHASLFGPARDHAIASALTHMDGIASAR